MESTPIPLILVDLLSNTAPPHTHHPSTDYSYPFLSPFLCRNNPSAETTQIKIKTSSNKNQRFQKLGKIILNL
jgi:hypothetical protein